MLHSQVPLMDAFGHLFILQLSQPQGLKLQLLQLLCNGLRIQATRPRADQHNRLGVLSQ
jgi:hypothetical protein